MRTYFTILIVALAACPELAAQGRPAPLPPVPAVRGPLRLVVAHPAPGAGLAVGDSTFLFGSLGDGRARLTVAGQAVPVAPNGTWLAWVAIPNDSAFPLNLEATLGSRVERLALPLHRTDWVRREGAWVDRRALSPTGDLVLPVAEPLALVVRAVAGARVRLLLPDGTAVPLAAESLTTASGGDRYVGVTRSAIGEGGELLVARALPTDAPSPMLEVVHGRDTTRMRWPLRVTRRAQSPLAVRLDDDTLHVGGTDRTTIGRATPGGTYHWFFPQGTRSRAEARINGDVRLRLDGGSVAWVPVDEVHGLPVGDDPRPAVMGSLSTTALPGSVRLRIPLTRPVPMRVDEELRGVRITLYDAVADADWTRYGEGTGFLDAATWRQETSDRVVVELHFDRLLWGWRVAVVGKDLMFEFREPPRIDPAHPLRGRHIVVDAGHPPAGACGPSGLCEPEANLAIARELEGQLRRLGARVTMTRRDNEAVGLWPRVAIADSVNAEVLISIHNNALADGVNPATNVGTGTFYNHLAALSLARAVQQGLLGSLGQADLGVGRGDLALVRPTWYPAILTEGLFLMLPEHEAALRTAVGAQRYASGIVAGLTNYLRNTARLSIPSVLSRP
ncbi:MAG: N-acetylmuramoyl-L-alanine amidase [Gemmatimonadota bacterium]